MTDAEMAALLRRLDISERNHSDLAKSLTEMVSDLNELRKPLDELRTDREVRKERDKHLHERLDRIDKTITDGLAAIKADVDARFARLNKPLWAAVLAFITAVVTTTTAFFLRGGFGGP